MKKLHISVNWRLLKYVNYDIYAHLVDVKRRGACFTHMLLCDGLKNARVFVNSRRLVNLAGLLLHPHVFFLS